MLVPLAVCDLCGEEGATLVVVDERTGYEQGVCDDCWQRIEEDDE